MIRPCQPARTPKSHEKQLPDERPRPQQQRPAYKIEPPTSSARRAGKLASMAGQTMLEFAIVAPLFLFLIFGVIDYGRLFFVEISVQDAIQEAARFASTGDHLPDPNNPGGTLSRVDSIIQTAQSAAFGASISNIQISSVQGGQGSAGGLGDVVTISLTTNLQLLTPIVAQFFPNGVYTFTSSATIKNEPFPANETN
jgi:Flp pilus assembly protein TadG